MCSSADIILSGISLCAPVSVFFYYFFLFNMFIFFFGLMVYFALSLSSNNLEVMSFIFVYIIPLLISENILFFIEMSVNKISILILHFFLPTVIHSGICAFLFQFIVVKFKFCIFSLGVLISNSGFTISKIFYLIFT